MTESLTGTGTFSIRDKLADSATYRSWMVDVNDGVIASAGILEGFASAGANDAMLLTVATAVTLAGALSLGGTKWAESAAEREAQLALVAEEMAELEASYEDEIQELREYWEGKGLSPGVAKEVAEELSAKDALAAQLEYEHGITSVMTRTETIFDGISAGLAFIAGSLIPLLISALVPARAETWALALVIVSALTITSVIAARTGHTSMRMTLVRTLGVGLTTMLITYLVGSMFV